MILLLIIYRLQGKTPSEKQLEAEQHPGHREFADSTSKAACAPGINWVYIVGSVMPPKGNAAKRAKPGPEPAPAGDNYGEHDGVGVGADIADGVGAGIGKGAGATPEGGGAMLEFDPAVVASVLARRLEVQWLQQNTTHCQNCP